MSSGNARDETLTSRLPQRQRGRDRVAALRAAAAALFLEKGYEAATMTEIAARAGASIGSLYLFFPTKTALAQTMVIDLADELSRRLDLLRGRCAGWESAAMADALFDELAAFLASHPVYAVLIELRGDDGWKHAMRLRRRSQIAALFAQASPALPDGQPERLALILAELMRINMVPDTGMRERMLMEVRAMLRHHLQASCPIPDRGVGTPVMAGEVRPSTPVSRHRRDA